MVQFPYFVDRKCINAFCLASTGYVSFYITHCFADISIYPPSVCTNGLLVLLVQARRLLHPLGMHLVHLNFFRCRVSQFELQDSFVGYLIRDAFVCSSC